MSSCLQGHRFWIEQILGCSNAVDFTVAHKGNMPRYAGLHGSRNPFRPINKRKPDRSEEDGYLIIGYLSNPYRKELSGAPFNMGTRKLLMQRPQLRSLDPKYESLRITQWWQAEEIFDTCAKFEPNARPTATEILARLNVNEPETSLAIRHLNVSQSTANSRE